MKKILAGIVLILGVLPIAVSAGTVRLGENYSLRKGENIQGDLYAIGSNTTVAGKIFGDLVATGLSVFIGGNEIEEDALVFADSAHVISDIKNDLRIIGRKVLVGGTIGEDAVVLSGSLELLPESVISGDLYAVGGNVSILGRIDGALKILGGEVFIDDEVGGDVSIRADKLVLGPHAKISGKLIYSASIPLEIRDGAEVKGETVFTQIDTRSQVEKLIPTLSGIWVFVRFVILLLSALIFHGVLRNISKRFVSVSLEHKGSSLLKGFLTIIGVPIAAFIGLLTFVGIPFSLLALALYGIGLIVARVYASIIFGSFIYRVALKRTEIDVTWKTISIGVLASMLLEFIPVIGPIFGYILILVALGGIYQVLYDKFIEVR